MFLQLTDINKKYGDKTILREVSLDLAAHGTMSILGRSGCGKSTLLKIIAGLEIQDRGSILLENRNVGQLPPNERNIVYLFQEPLLFPHLTVYKNIAFGLSIRKLPAKEIQSRCEEILESLELSDHSTKMPHQLSGGQKQRVAFGRALIINPPLILLDEPFSSLDLETRGSMQQLYKRIASEFKITALFVTHDLKEALLMGDKLSYMEDGCLRIFDSHDDFINDERTGVMNEMIFWSRLTQRQSDK